MEIETLVYRPLSQSIVNKEFVRQTGYRSSQIHMHDHDEIVLVTSASRCLVTNNGRSFYVDTPAIWFNRAGSFHEVTQVTDGTYASHVLFFLPDTLSAIPDEACAYSRFSKNDLTIIPLSPQQTARLSTMFSLLSDSSSPQKSLLVLNILLEMDRLSSGNSQVICANSTQTYIFDAIRIIQEGEYARTIDAFASAFHISPTKFKMDFKKITGVSFGVFKNHVRLQKAMILLDSGNTSLSQIAFTCGFSDESHFIETFKRAHGITPGAYRKKKQLST